MRVKEVTKYAHLICFMLLAGCSTGRSGHYISDRIEQNSLPRSVEVLDLPPFKQLGHYELRYEGEQLLIAGTAYETWSDQRFVENSSLTLRYRYQYDPAIPESGRTYKPVVLGIDMEFPSSAVHIQAADALIGLLQQKWNISLNSIRSVIDGQSTSDVLPYQFWPLKTAIVEIAVRDLGPRGKSISIDFYEPEFYRRNFQR